jgi:UDP-glucose 4-epimerase
VDDLAEGHCLALEKLNAYSGALNLGTGIGTSVKDVITAAEKISGRACPVEYAARREGDPAKLFAANAKARDILGWTPRRSLDDIVSSAWKWENNRSY